MTEIEMLKDIYSAINRNAVSEVLAFFDPQIERIEPASFPSTVTYRGLAEVSAHFSRARDTWAEGSCETERFIVAGDKVVVFVHVRVRLKNNLDWIEGRIADGFTFRNGKVIQMHTFIERQQALDWAGIREGL